MRIQESPEDLFHCLLLLVIHINLDRKVSTWAMHCQRLVQCTRLKISQFFQKLRQYRTDRNGPMCRPQHHIIRLDTEKLNHGTAASIL